MSKSTWIHQPVAMFCAIAAGLASASLYVWIFRDDFAGPPPPKFNMADPSARRIFETIITIWATAATVGQCYYRLVGEYEEEYIARRSVGGYALFLLIVGGIFMLGTLIANLAQGQRPTLRDSATLIVGLSSLVEAFIEWRRPPFVPIPTEFSNRLRQ